MELLAILIVALFGFILCGMSLLILVRPDAARRFFNVFASSIKAHFAEQFIRLIVGIALVVLAPSMRWAAFFNGLGVLLVVTAIALMLTPWRLHQRFAVWVMPIVYQHFQLFALAAFVLGVFIIYGWLGLVLN